MSLLPGQAQLTYDSASCEGIRGRCIACGEVEDNRVALLWPFGGGHVPVGWRCDPWPQVLICEDCASFTYDLEHEDE